MSLRVEAGFQHIKDALAQVIAKEVEFLPGMLVTVLDAKVTANTSHAKITLSCFPETMQKEALTILEENQAVIKNGLTERLRLRRMPRLHYVFDETAAYVAGVDQALYEIKQKGEL